MLGKFTPQELARLQSGHFSCSWELVYQGVHQGFYPPAIFCSVPPWGGYQRYPPPQFCSILPCGYQRKHVESQPFKNLLLYNDVNFPKGHHHLFFSLKQPKTPSSLFPSSPSPTPSCVQFKNRTFQILNWNRVLSLACRNHKILRCYFPLQTVMLRFYLCLGFKSLRKHILHQLPGSFPPCVSSLDNCTLVYVSRGYH
jgi:hypothetical protein